MIFFELLFAHLLGDFMFQSNDLIQKKYKSWKGILEHVFIIAACTVLILFPYWQYTQTWIAIVLIILTHFFQDWLKIYIERKHNQSKSTLPFFIDQFVHVFILFIVNMWFWSLEPARLSPFLERLYESKLLSIYLVGLILFSYTYDITVYQFKKQKSQTPLEYEPDYSGMAERLCFYSGGFVLFLLVISNLT